MTRGRVMAAVAMAMTAAGCGTESNRDPKGTQAPDGIYVDELFHDEGDGSLAAPLNSINQGLRKAAATGKTTVNVFQGNYAEVVELLPGITLQGSVCRDEALTISEQCSTRIHGGSPSILAHDLSAAALVRDFNVESLHADDVTASHRFRVPGLGCVGRAVSAVTSMPACDQEIDSEGRHVPDNSIGIALERADVRFERVWVSAGRGGDGMDGEVGAAGEKGLAGISGGAAGAAPYAYGMGAQAPASAACPEARGGNGGNGGYFIGSNPFVIAAQPGANSSLGAAGGAPTAFHWRKNFQYDGGIGKDGADAEPATDGAMPSAAALDLSTLMAPAGGDGLDGAAGTGGGGGAGGTAATRKAFRVSYNGVSAYMEFWAIGGAVGDSGKVLLQQIGELPGGGGASGGSGGCGGRGGKGGQGGGASIGIHAVDSNVTFVDGHLRVDYAGQGGDGGRGGRGGSGGSFASSSFGKSNPEEGVTGSFDSNGEWMLSPTSPRTAGKGPAISGGGGQSGRGGRGADGGFGRGGAGGAQIGIVTRGSSHAIVDGTIFTIPSGRAGGMSEAPGPNGLSAEMVSLAP